MEASDKILFVCPACQFRARIPSQYVGRTIRCPGCNAAQKVAAPEVEPESTGRTVAITRVAAVDSTRVEKPVPPEPPAPPAAAPVKPAAGNPLPEDKLLFVCASCKLRARVPARFGGQTIRCPKCQTPGTVPRTTGMEQSTGQTVMISRAQLEAPPPKPTGSGRWRDPTKVRPPTPATSPAGPPPPTPPAPPGDDLDSLLGDAPAAPANAPADDAPAGDEPVAGEPPADEPVEGEAAAPAPPTEEEEDPLAESAPEIRPRPGVVHRRGNSSSAIEIPKSAPKPTGKPGARGGKPAGKSPPPAQAKPAAVDDGEDAAPAPAKRGPLGLILGILLLAAIGAAAWGWMTAMSARQDAEDARGQLATMKGRAERAEKARDEAVARASDLAAKLSAASASAPATATGGATTDEGPKP
jgi:hypothetical protein